MAEEWGAGPESIVDTSPVLDEAGEGAGRIGRVGRTNRQIRRSLVRDTADNRVLRDVALELLQCRARDIPGGRIEWGIPSGS
jgi:hypothetical protein